MRTLSTQGARKERESRAWIIMLVVLFLVVNLLLSYLSTTYSWYIVATDRMFYTLSGVTDEYFARVNPKKHPVEFYFCMSREGLTENITFARILDTVEQFDERYDFFTMKHVDPYYDHDMLERFAKEHELELDAQSVIVYCPATGKSEVRALSTFYYFDTEDTTNDDMIFNGEEIVASLVGGVVVKDRPEALFTMGHGEAPTASLMNALYSAGYEVKAQDISSSAIPEATRVVVIAAPKYDFEEYADKNIECEISRLRDFVKAGGTVLFFRDTSAGELTRLERFYSEYGITAERGMISDGTHSVDTSAKAVLLRYDAGEGAKALREYAQKYNDSRLVAAGVSPLTLSGVNGVTVTPLLRSFHTAENQVNGETISVADDAGYTVSALATTAEYHGKRGHVALIAAEAFADVDTMETDGYGNKEFIFSLLEETSGAATPIGCGVVLLNTYPLEDMTRGTANVYLAVFAGVIPLSVAAVGVFVLRRRARR